MWKLPDAEALSLEQQLFSSGFSLVAGADEAGRGACAGPLVAAAVVIEPGVVIEGLADSKQLTQAKREAVYARILDSGVAWSVVEISPEECDALGVQVANLTALRRALLRLQVTPDFALIDGFMVDGLGFPALGVWKGDKVAASVSAASVIAKVTRDRIMKAISAQYPQYRFEIHKGYCTKLHQALMVEFGPSPIHRLSYSNVLRAREQWLAGAN